VNDVVISDLLVNYQLFSIVGFSGAGARFRKSDLAAKIASIAGGSLDEKNYIDEAVLESPGFASFPIIYSIIESSDIVITLNGGHGLTELHYYCFPATSLVQAPNVAAISNF